MPTLNPNKCYAQQPQRLTITEPQKKPTHWRTEFYEQLSAQLKLNDDKTEAQEEYDHQINTWVLLTKKELFFKALERHLGEQSTYTLKSQLLDSFRRLYFLFTHPNTTPEQKCLIASKIKEDVDECSPGFYNRVQRTIYLFNIPQNMDELIAQVRFNLADRIASIIAANNTQGIHVHNRVIEVARRAGFGIWPINTGDVYSHIGSRYLSDNEIIDLLKSGFANHFQLFALVNALRDELEALIVPHGYQGKRDLDNNYKKKEYGAFCEYLNLFTPIPMNDLLEKDTMSGKVTNIHWQHVKRALLQQLRDKGYITLSYYEAVLLDSLLLNEHRTLNLILLNIPIIRDYAYIEFYGLEISNFLPLSTLIPHGYELVQCLEFFNQWNMELKGSLVNAYLKNKSPNEQKEVLAILHNEPKLRFAFAIAIAEKNIASVRTYVEAGENINDALLLLFGQEHKRDTLYWIYEHPYILQQITVAGMNTVIAQDKFQGKTIAEMLMSTKKGRQLLLENVLLQTLLAQTTLANRLTDYLQQAEAERRTVNTHEGFFKKFSPLATVLVQAIVYGDLKKSQALLEDNSSLLKTLLTEKITVIDYSRRKIKQKTAFQAALCAMDEVLCAMLAKYMTKEEMARQYQEIFPEGHEAYYQQQTPFDFSQIVEAISNGSDEDIQKALNLKLPNNTGLWGQLEQFRANFTKRSSQESVFNPQHLLKAYDLSESQFNSWNSNQINLFWIQIIGYVQRFLPANIAMDFAQGAHARVEKKEKPARSLKFRDSKGAFFPVEFDSISGLGYKWCVTVWDDYGYDSRWLGKIGHLVFSKLMSSKNSDLERIIQAEASWNLCIIL